MRLQKYGIMLVGLLLAASSMLMAEDKSEHSVTITDPVNIGSTQLSPGHYKVAWQGAGPTVQVRFLHDGKTVASSDAKLVNQNHKSPYDDVVTKKTGISSSSLEEIDFQNQNQALVFSRRSGV
jgi:hypothetical protein